MKHYGDICKISGYEVPTVNVVIGGSPCFAAGTLITTDRGLVPIEDVKIGDSVFTHKRRFMPVTDSGCTGRKMTYTLKCMRCDPLIVTGNHPIYVRKRGKNVSEPAFVPVSDLSADYCVGSPVVEIEENKLEIVEDGYIWYPIISIEPNAEVDVYNLSVQEDESYCANNIAVHNCQDLSVAGKRAGIAGERSGLFMEQLRIIKEMREKDAKSGRTGVDIRPRFMVWENVIGAFSVNEGRDFAAVLEETIKVAEPEIPDIHVPGDGWTLSGTYVGRGWSVAWRVLDAQFWGVPQRRRRIALIADFGGESAPEILFKSNSLQRYIKQSKETGQGTSEDVTDCARNTGKSRTYGVTSKGNGDAFITEEYHIALSTGGGEAGQGYPCIMQPVASEQNQSAITDTVAIEGNGSRESHLGDGYSVSDKMYTLNTVEQHSVCYGISAYESNAMKSDNPHSGVYEADTARTLDLNGGNPACNQGGIAIVEISAGFCPRAGAKAEGIGYAVEQAPTLRANGDAGVVCPDVAKTLTSRNDESPCIDRGHDVICVEMTSTKNTVSDDGISPTLTARMGTGGNQVNAVVTKSAPIACDVFHCDSQNDKAFTLKARDFKDPPVVVQEETTAVDCRNGTENPDINGTLQAKDNGGTSINLNNVVRQRYVVRRLTPLECTRLQGFPDGWLDIGDWYDDNGKLHKESDSVKYKALGNSIAIPPWLFVLGSLSEYCEDKTMASLFDGIGGFPLIWSFLNGKDACKWSSEIDPFCRAVSRVRFPDDDEETELL